MFALHPRTDAGSFAVFDPGALAGRIPPMSPGKLEERLTKEVGAANLLLFDPHADGDYWLQLFVGEEVPERLAKRAKQRVSGHLRVPGGRIVAVGTEELATRPDPKAAPKMGDQALIAPGTYRVEAFTLDWRGREINAEIKKRTDPAVLAKHQRREAFMAITFYATIFGTLAFLIKLANYGRANWSWWLGVLLFLWGLVVFLFRWYSRSEIKLIRDQVEADFPFVVMHFNKAEPESEGGELKGFRMDLDE